MPNESILGVEGNFECLLFFLFDNFGSITGVLSLIIGRVFIISLSKFLFFGEYSNI
jgi:hypothetical protein